MKRKSVPGFVLGIIGILSSFVVGYILYAVMTIVFAFSSAFGAENLLLTILFYAHMVAPILAIIGVCFYFNKARVGGILMLVATILNVALPIYFILNNSDLSIQTFGFLIPAIFMFISAICGIFSKSTQPKLIAEQVNQNYKTTAPEYCVNCGNKLDTNTQFCPNCGKKVK